MNVLILSDGQPYQQEFIRNLDKTKHGFILGLFTYLRATQNKTKIKPSQQRWGAMRDRVHRLIQKVYLRFPSPVSMPTISFEAAEVNKPKTAKKIKSLNPDVILTCGAPILKGEILKTARLGVYNVHFGISPSFRGNDTVFWTFYSGIYDLIGGTLHEIDSGIDTGKVIGQVFPKITRFDGVATSEIKIAREMALLTNSFLSFLEKKDSTAWGLIQEGEGRLFLSRHRTMLKDIRSALKFLFRMFFFKFEKRSNLKYF